MTVLVTGASGLLGRRVLERLGRDARPLAHRSQLPDAVQGDLLDRASLERAVEGVDAVVHLAAVTHARDPRVYARVNADGTRNLVDVAAGRRFVFVSTRAIDPRGGAYSRSKAEAERVVRESLPDATIVRLPEVYGAGSSEGVDALVSRARTSRFVPVVGDGGDVLCPIHVDDAADAVVAALDPRAAGKTYTLAGEPVAVAEVVRRAGTARIVHVPVPVAAALASASRYLPLPLVPDQVARLRSPKPPPSPEAARDLGFAPRPFAPER